MSLLRERVEAVEGRVPSPPAWAGGDEGVDAEDVDVDDDGDRQIGVRAPRRVFPELITEVAEPGEELVYGAAAELVVEWREAWAARKSARYTLDWLRAEWRRLDLELRLIGVFGLTPPPADAPWRERRRDEEVDWRRRVLWRLRWQIPLTWCPHWLLRTITLGLWGRTHPRGSNQYGQSSNPAGQFRSVSAGLYHNCGVRPDGAVTCWGLNDRGQAAPPAGEFLSVDAGYQHTCGLTVNGHAQCWGSNAVGQAEAPTDRFADVSAGYHHTCGLRSNGRVECWGSSTYGQTDPPPGPFATISLGLDHACGLLRNGSVRSWGDNQFGQAQFPSEPDQ